MLFNSSEFLLFFPIVVCLYFLAPHRFRVHLLLAASYYFYASWKFEYLFLIIFSTLIDYYCGLRMASYEDKSKRLPFLYLSLITNLGLLFAFKYLGFFSSCFGGPDFNILLPVGISFYTFQTLSYSFDVYKGRKKAENNLSYFALYVCFFPQLVAGPIERSSRLLPQLKREHKFDPERVRSGLVLMLWGFFRKIFIADNLAMYIDSVYQNYQDYSGLVVLLAALLFGFQIYLDFAAYSEIAIGAAQVMGINLMQNFKRPFLGSSLTDLWQRWHISLVTWFRDYIYLPLTKSKDSMFKRSFNMVLIFFLSGLWHGANWTFVLWGFLNGLFLVLENLTKDRRKKIYDLLIPNQTLKNIVRSLITIVLFCVVGILFRASNLDQAFTMMASLFDWRAYNFNFAIEHQKILAFGLLSILLTLGFEFAEERYSFETIMIKTPVALRWFAYCMLIMAAIAFIPHKSQNFIYFQF